MKITPFDTIIRNRSRESYLDRSPSLQSAVTDRYLYNPNKMSFHNLDPEDSLKKIYRDLYENLEKIKDELLSDPVYRIQIIYQNDRKIKLISYLNILLMVVYLFAISISTILNYIHNIKNYWDIFKTTFPDIKYEFSRWLFYNPYYLKQHIRNPFGPITLGFLYIIIAIPIIDIISCGEEYYKRQNYFIKYMNWKYLNKRVPDNHRLMIYWDHKAMRIKQRQEFFQGIMCTIVLIIISFTAENIASLIINTMSVHFISQIDEFIFRIILFKYYNLNRISVDEYYKIWM